MTEPARLDIQIPESEDGERLDRALARLVEGRSRARIQKDLEAQAITLNGATPSRGAKTTVRAGDLVVYRPPAPEPLELVAEDIPLSVVFEDEHLLVVDKAAGMVVHPALGHPRGTLVNAVLHHVKNLERAQDDLRPGIVHRLDRDTTGLIVVAKTPRCHERLSRLFKDRLVDKTYLAVTRGTPKPTRGTYDTKFGRHRTDRKRFSSKVHEGKHAVTHYEVKEDFRCAARVEVRLETGRTHQIRVHFSDARHPLVGDDMYGRNRPLHHPDRGHEVARFDRPALHAQRLGFVHPFTGERVDFEAPVPEDLEALLTTLRSV